jgi:hypothetical protein
MTQTNPLIIHPDGTTEALAYTPPQDEEDFQGTRSASENFLLAMTAARGVP